MIPFLERGGKDVVVVEVVVVVVEGGGGGEALSFNFAGYLAS